MRSLLVLVALALLLIPTAGSAQTFQWESLGLSDEDAIPTGTFGQMGCGYAVRVDWSTVTDGGTFVPFAGDDFISYDDDQLGAHTGYLSAGFNNSLNDPDDQVTITLVFNDSVEDLAFSLTDIDDNSWHDAVEVTYNGGINTKFSPYVSFSSPPVFNDNETYMEGYEAGGGPVAPPSSAGNINFDFGAGAGVLIDEVEITYFSGDDANSNPGSQLIGLTDLTISCDNPTAVLITDVRQMNSNGETWLEWETAWQSDTVGFFAHRWDPISRESVPLHSTMLSALEKPDGGVFAALDMTGEQTDEAWYLIEEVRANGKSAQYGPFLATKTDSTTPIPGRSSEAGLQANILVQDAGASWSYDKPMDTGEFNRLTAALSERLASSSRVGHIGALAETRSTSRRDWLKLEVDPGSVVAVDFGTMAASWGIPVDEVRRLAWRQKLQVRHEDESIAWTVDSDRLLFYARPEEPKFAYTTNYWLRIGGGLSMEEIKAEAKPADLASAVRVEHKSEVDTTALTANANASEEDLYFWKLLSSASPAAARQSFSVQVEDRLPGTGLSLTVEALGVVVGAPGSSDQQLDAYIGGTSLGGLNWNTDQPFVASLNVPGGTVSEAAIAIVDLDLQSVAGATGNLAFIDSLTVGYTRRASADGGYLEFEAIESGVVTVADVSDNRPVVLDVTDPKAPRRLPVVLDTTTGRLGVKADAGQRFVVAHGGGVRAPNQLTPITRGGAWRELGGAQYVVVAPTELLTGAAELADFRNEYSTMVVDAQDLYDFYTDGAKDPAAIQRFLKFATRRWAVKPEFAVLIGGTSYDRKNVDGLGENLMPTYFARTPHGLFSTDIPFVDLDRDRLPDLSVGRIPAVSNAEVSAYVRKLADQTAPRGGFRASLLADNADAAGDFTSASAELRARFESSAAVQINGLVPGHVAAFREQLQNDIAAGMHWGNYFGHGSVDRMGAEALMTVDDVASLTGTYLPTLTALTCQIGRLEFPGHQSLAEALVLGDGAGALAVWGASGLSQQGEAKEIADAFIGVHADQQNMTLGEAVNATLERYAAGSPVDYMQTLYTLFGDPAVDSPLVSAPLELVGDGTDDGSPDDAED